MANPCFPVDIPLAGGIEDKVFRALVPPGKMLTTKGAQFDKVGAVDLAPGFDLVSTESGTTCTGLLSDGRIMNRTLDAEEYDPSRVTTLSVPPPDTSERPAIVLGGDVAVYGDYAYVIVTTMSSGAHDFPYLAKVSLKDRTSSIVTTLTATTGSMIRVVVSGSYLYVFYMSGANARYRCWNLVSETEIGGSPFLLGASSANFGMSACADASSSRRVQGYCWVAWLNAANNLQVSEILTSTATLKYSDATVVATASPAIEPSSTVSTRYSFAVPTATVVKGYVWDASGGLARSGTVITSIVPWCTPTGVELSGTFYWLASRIMSGTPYEPGISAGYITPTANGGLSQIIHGCTPSSHPFVRDGRMYLWARYTKAEYTAVPIAGAVQPTEFLLRVNPSGTTGVAFAFAVAAVNQNESMGSATFETYNARFNPSSIVQYGSSYLSASVVEPQSLRGLSVFGAVVLAKIEFDVQSRSAVIGRKHVLTGGFAHEYNGREIVESNFVLYPEIISYAFGGGGSLVPGTTYYVKAVYCGVDNNGERHMSSPTVALQITPGAGQTSISFRVSKYCFGRRDFAVRIYLSVDGVSYYLSEEGFYRRDGVDTTIEEVVVALSFSTSNQLLYTVGGVLDNGGTPCLTDVVAHGDRFYGITPDGTICYSKPVVDGIGIEWSPELLTHEALADGGSHWQLASMDGQLIVFGEHSIQVVTGDGADNTGSGSSLSVPRLVPCDSWLLDKSYVVASRHGVWFQTLAGLHLLTRGLEIDVDAGASIEDLISTKLLRAGVFVASRNETWFSFGPNPPADLSSGTTYIFDDGSRAWIETNVGSACWGMYHGLGLDSSGNLWKVDSISTGKYLKAMYVAAPTYDDGFSITTPWMKIGSLSGTQRLCRAVLNGEWLSDMILTVTFSYDFDDAVVNSWTYAYKNTVGRPRVTNQPFVWRQHVGRRCSAVKIAISVTPEANPRLGACCRLFGLTLELAQRPGLLKTSAAHER